MAAGLRMEYYGDMSDTPISSPTEHPTLSTLFLDGVQQLDPRQWSRLVETFGPIVYRWCRVAGVPEADAADLVQDVFTSVARNIAAFERQKDSGSFRCWLATITRNQVRDFFRSASRRVEAQGGTAAHQWMLDQVDRLEESIDGESISTPLLKTMLEDVKAEFEDSTWQAFWLTIRASWPYKLTLGSANHTVFQHSFVYANGGEFTGIQINSR